MYIMARQLKEKVAISSKPVVTPATQPTEVPAQEDPMAKLKPQDDTTRPKQLSCQGCNPCLRTPAARDPYIKLGQLVIHQKR
jgi:hypothetical protein